MSGADNTSFTVRTNSEPFVIDRSVGANDYVMIYNANNSQTAYIPPADTVPPGRQIYYVNASSSTLTILCTEQLDGVPGGSVAPTEFARFISDGENWWTIDVL
jgi:hypothetical protein